MAESRRIGDWRACCWFLKSVAYSTIAGVRGAIRVVATLRERFGSRAARSLRGGIGLWRATG
jgi:hypothetical protein